MNLRVLFFLLTVPCFSNAAPTNPFFAMDTGTKGEPDVVVPSIAELGFTGMSGHAANFQPLGKALTEKGLKLYTTYFTTALEIDKPALEAQPAIRPLIESLENSGTVLWLGIQKVTREGTTLQHSEIPDPLLATRLHEIASFANEHGVHVSLYPHAGFAIEKVEHALLLVRQIALPNISVTFNLCHWLKVEGDRDPTPVLREALPHLSFVTLNGADAGDTKTFPWNQLIQVIGHGDYDLAAFMRILHTLGYTGPIGLQHYGIPGDWKENLSLSMSGWQALP